MALRRRRFAGRRSSPSRRRQLLWARTRAPIAGSALAAGPSFASVDLLADAETATGARMEDATVMAIKGVFYAGLGVSPCQVKWGIKVMSRALFASGMTAANSGPLTNPYEDWMWTSTYWAPGAGITPAFPNANRNVELNIRSRRRLRNLDDTLVLLGEAPATATASVAFFDLSVLLALA